MVRVQMGICMIWLDCCFAANMCASRCLTQVMAIGSELASDREFGRENSVFREAAANVQLYAV